MVMEFTEYEVASDLEVTGRNTPCVTERLSTIPPNTLVRNVPGGELGLWFRQNRGVVSPGGWLPVVFGDPKVEIVEEVRYEPSRQAELWRRKNLGCVTVFTALRRSYDGDSSPMARDTLIRGMREAEAYGWRRPKTAAAVLAQLPEMIEEGLVEERFEAIGLSIHAREEGRLHLTSAGMAEAIRKGIGFEEEQPSGRVLRSFWSRLAQLGAPPSER